MAEGTPYRPIIDCHTHIFPEWRRQKLIGWARRILPDHPVPLDVDIDTAVAMLQAAGTERWVNLLFPLRAGEADELHTFNAELVRRYPGCVPVGGVHAADQDPVGLVRRGFEEFGMVGVKFHPLVQRFAPIDARLSGVFEYLERIAGMVYIHTGFESWYGQERQFTDVVEVVRRHPGITFVLPHLAYPQIHDAVILATDCPNVWLDLTNLPTTGSPHPPRGVEDMVGHNEWEAIRVQVREAVEQIAGRVVYGTDHPAGLDDPCGLLEDLLSLGLTEPMVNEVLWHNPTRLLNHAIVAPKRARDMALQIESERPR